MFATFSGYIAVDELYDGDTTLLSLVDNRKHRRIMFEILDHPPTQADIIAFFKRFKQEMEKRGRFLLGITTDGSPLYPEAIRQVFGAVPHQICVFHVLKEINRAILKAVAQVRQNLAKDLPKMPRGRPNGKEGRQAARKKRRLENKIADIFKHRYLFVARHLSAEDQKTLARISRGLPILRTLRTIANDVYCLFDRRCRMATAQNKLAKLRQRVARFKKLSRLLKKLSAPTVERALVFLDEKLLPSTSNAVERTNRRFRKMQRAIYRARTTTSIRKRVALDLLREAHLATRFEILRSLSRQRLMFLGKGHLYPC